MPLRLLREPVDGGQPEAGARAVAFGGEEGLRGAAEDFQRHPGARVGDHERNVLAGGHLACGDLGRLRTQAHPAGRNGDGAAVRHRVARVQQEVDERHLDLPGVRETRREVPVQARFEADGRTQGALRERAHRGDEGVQVHHAAVELLPAGEGEELPGQALGARDGLAHAQGQVVPPLRAVRLLHQFEVPGDHHQQVVEVVRDAAGELPDGLHSLRAVPRRFRGALARHIELAAEEVEQFAARAEHGTDVQRIPKRRAVVPVVHQFDGDGLAFAERAADRADGRRVGFRALQEPAIPAEHLVRRVPGHVHERGVRENDGVVRFARVGNDHRQVRPLDGGEENVVVPRRWAPHSRVHLCGRRRVVA